MSKKNGESKKTFQVVQRSHKKARMNKVTSYGSSSGTVPKGSQMSRCQTAKMKARALKAKANMKRIQAQNRRVASKHHKSHGQRRRRRKSQNKKTTRSVQIPPSTSVADPTTATNNASARSHTVVHDSSMNVTVSSNTHIHIFARDYSPDEHQEDHHQEYHDARTYDFHQAHSYNFGVQHHYSEALSDDDDDPMQEAS